ncbi:hypothetical protein FUSNEC_GEN_165_09570 [Fusobacterium necrophorum subsp. funduliforme]
MLFQFKFNLFKASLTFLTALEVASVLELSKSSASDFDRLNPFSLEILGSFSAIKEVSLFHKSNAPFAVNNLLESFSVKFVFSKFPPLFHTITSCFSFNFLSTNAFVTYKSGTSLFTTILFTLEITRLIPISALYGPSVSGGTNEVSSPSFI